MMLACLGEMSVITNGKSTDFVCTIRYAADLGEQRFTERAFPTRMQLTEDTVKAGPHRVHLIRKIKRFAEPDTSDYSRNHRNRGMNLKQ